MSQGRDQRTVVISAVVSAVIAGLFGVVIKTVPEGVMTRLVPYQGGIIIESAPGTICQVVRFWVPSKLPSNLNPETIVNDLNGAVTRLSGGWTRWPVNGEWKDAATDRVIKEGGFLYEVGITECDTATVQKVRKLVERFVLRDMQQASLYFVATRFDKGT